MRRGQRGAYSDSRACGPLGNDRGDKRAVSCRTYSAVKGALEVDVSMPLRFQQNALPKRVCLILSISRNLFDRLLEAGLGYDRDRRPSDLVDFVTV